MLLSGHLKQILYGFLCLPHILTHDVTTANAEKSAAFHFRCASFGQESFTRAWWTVEQDSFPWLPRASENLGETHWHYDCLFQGLLGFGQTCHIIPFYIWLFRNDGLGQLIVQSFLIVLLVIIGQDLLGLFALVIFDVVGHFFDFLGEVVECLLEGTLVAATFALQQVHKFEIVILGIVLGFGHVGEATLLDCCIEGQYFLLNLLFVQLPSIVYIHFWIVIGLQLLQLYPTSKRVLSQISSTKPAQSVGCVVIKKQCEKGNIILQQSSIRILEQAMQTNLWNIKSGKERLGIRERTQAHKRHLISLVKAKSILDDKNKQWKLKSLNADLNRRRKQNIHRDNKELVERIWKVERSESSRIKSSKEKKFTQITENLRTVASINRFNKHKLIQQENDKFFNRLINTSPTLSRRSWVKDIKENEKYKLNMTRTKYATPNYSDEVSKVIKTKKMTFKHLKLSRCSDALPNLNTSRLKTLRS